VVFATRVIESDRREWSYFATFEALAPSAFRCWQWLHMNDETAAGMLWGNESPAGNSANGLS
jgi:hypothetical protein